LIACTLNKPFRVCS